jgi:hypothetical protein
MKNFKSSIPNESTIVWPEVDTYKQIPSFNDYEIWEFVSKRGVRSDDPKYFKYCFDTLFHIEGILFYRMKESFPPRVIVKREGKDGKEVFPPSVVFYNPEESFMFRINSGDNLVLMRTHDGVTGEPAEVLENITVISYHVYENFMAWVDSPLDRSANNFNFKGHIMEYISRKKGKCDTPIPKLTALQLSQLREDSQENDSSSSI